MQIPAYLYVSFLRLLHSVSMHICSVSTEIFWYIYKIYRSGLQPGGGRLWLAAEACKLGIGVSLY